MSRRDFTPVDGQIATLRLVLSATRGVADEQLRDRIELLAAAHEDGAVTTCLVAAVGLLRTLLASDARRAGMDAETFAAVAVDAAERAAGEVP